MELLPLFYSFGVALGIGLLIGLQREYAFDPDQAHEKFAGIRTFSLMSLFGWTAAFLADQLENPLVFVGLIFPGALLILLSYYLIAQQGSSVGLTTEFAALLTLLIGASAYWHDLVIPVALGVITFVLLSLKLELHSLVARITREDILATLKFAIITAIILPVLPNRSFGPPPFDVLNPYKIWLMVVLISGINFLGYVMIKIVGSRRGISLTGFLGGLVSSTAVTLSFTKSSRTQPALAKPFALAITISWLVMFIRVLVEVSVLNIPLLQVLWIPIVITIVVTALYCVYLYISHHPEQKEDHIGDITNPFELGPAIQFGLLYGVILFVSRTAQLYFGDSGVFVSSIVSGVADVDAITLSLSELSRSEGNLALATAAQAIVLATVSNTVVKGGIVIAGSAPSLRRAIIPIVLLVLLTALGVSFFTIG